MLRSKAKSAVMWTMGFNFISDLTQFIFMLVMVRLLTPTAYGQIGLANSVVSFMVVFSCRHFIAYTLQVRNDRDVHYQDQFTAGAIIQVIVFFLTNSVAVLMVFIPNHAPASLLIHIMSIQLLLDLPAEMDRKMLERILEWKRVRSLQAIGLLTGSVIAFVLAVFGAGVYALIAPSLISPLPFIYDLFLFRKWRPSWKWSFNSYKPALLYGITLSFAGIISLGRQLLESILFVQLVGYANFGFFGRAIAIGQMFSLRIATELMYAIYPVLTKIEPRSAAYSRVSGLILLSVTWFVIPVGIVLSKVAAPLIHIIYGRHWEAVIPMVPWAMAVSIARAMAYAAYMLLLSNQRERYCLYSDIALSLGTGVALFWLLPNGINLYLMGTTVIQISILLVMFIWLFRDRSLSFSGIVRAFLPPLIASLIATVSCESIWILIEKNSWYGLFFVYVAGFSLVYLVVLRLFFSKPLKELLPYLPKSSILSSLLCFK